MKLKVSLLVENIVLFLWYSYMSLISFLILLDDLVYRIFGVNSNLYFLLLYTDSERKKLQLRKMRSKTMEAYFENNLEYIKGATFYFPAIVLVVVSVIYIILNKNKSDKLSKYIKIINIIILISSIILLISNMYYHWWWWDTEVV